MSYLKRLGYSAVRVPRADLRAGQVLIEKNHALIQPDALTAYFSPDGTAAPEPTDDSPATNLQGQMTDRINVGVGLTILGSFLSAMGGKLGINAGYRQAKTMEFLFQDVLVNRLSIPELDRFLATADVLPGPTSNLFLEADRLYVLSETVKTRKLSVTARRSDGAELGLDLPGLQGIVGGNINIRSENDRNTVVTYEGNLPLVFGFKAVQIVWDRGTFKRLKLADSQLEAREISPPEDEGANEFVTTSPFIDLSAV